MAGVTVGSIDFLGANLTVDWQLDRKGNLEEPKSESSKATLACPQWLMDELAAVMARRGLTGADTGALLFVSPEGALLRYSNWRRRVWLPSTQAAGLEALGTKKVRVPRTPTKEDPSKSQIVELPALGFHDLRSNTATALVDEGVNVKIAQHWMRQSSVQVTLGLYARITASGDRNAADAMETRFQPRTGRALGSSSKEQRATKKSG